MRIKGRALIERLMACYATSREPSIQFSWGLWHASQGEPRTAGAVDEGRIKNQICSQWLPEMTRVRRPVGWVSRGIVLPLRSKIVRGVSSALMGIQDCCAKPLLRKLSSAPELTRKEVGKELWDQIRVPVRVRREGSEGQEEAALANTLACAGELTHFCRSRAGGWKWGHRR